MGEIDRVGFDEVRQVKTTESRVAALEQSAKLLAAQPKPHTSGLAIEDFHRIVKEIKTRERPVRTPEEQRAHFEECFKRMDADWELRYGKS